MVDILKRRRPTRAGSTAATSCSRPATSTRSTRCLIDGLTVDHRRHQGRLPHRGRADGQVHGDRPEAARHVQAAGDLIDLEGLLGTYATVQAAAVPAAGATTTTAGSTVEPSGRRPPASGPSSTAGRRAGSGRARRATAAAAATSAAPLGAAHDRPGRGRARRRRRCSPGTTNSVGGSNRSLSASMWRLERVDHRAGDDAWPGVSLCRLARAAWPARPSARTGRARGSRAGRRARRRRSACGPGDAEHGLGLVDGAVGRGQLASLGTRPP